jgi:5-methylcytosine-specific restriction endonuclease McrA
MVGRLVTATCQNCGKTFQCSNQPRVRKTCSKECQYAMTANKNSTEHVIINCERCGKAIETTPYKASKGKRFCSFECASPALYVTCQNCGISFRSSPSNHQKYCSKQCVDSSELVRVARANSVRQAWKDEEKRIHIMEGIGKRSNSDDWKSAAHFQKGEKHPRFKGNRSTRTSSYENKQFVKEVLKRDSYTCQHCGSKEYLHVHHIQAWAEYPELRYEVTNGITVCEECHIKIHGGKRKPRTRVCAYCQKSFRPKKKSTQYCCKACFYSSLKRLM